MPVPSVFATEAATIISMLCVYVLRIVLLFIYGSVVAAATNGLRMLSFAVGAYSAHGPLRAFIAVLYGMFPTLNTAWKLQLPAAEHG